MKCIMMPGCSSWILENQTQFFPNINLLTVRNFLHLTQKTRSPTNQENQVPVLVDHKTFNSCEIFFISKRNFHIF